MRTRQQFEVPDAFWECTLNGVQKAKFVDMPSRMWKEIADPHSMITMPTELEGTSHQFIFGPMQYVRKFSTSQRLSNRIRERLATLLLQYGFVIEGIHRGWTADHEEHDD